MWRYVTHNAVPHAAVPFPGLASAKVAAEQSDGW